MTIRCIMNTKRPNHPIIVMIKSDFLHFECSLLVGQECSTFLILFSLAFKFALGNKEVRYDKALISTSTVLHWCWLEKLDNCSYFLIKAFGWLLDELMINIIGCYTALKSWNVHKAVRRESVIKVRKEIM